MKKISKTEIDRLERGGAKIHKKKVVRKAPEKQVIPEKNKEAKEAERALEISLKATEVAVNVIDKTQKTQINIDNLVDALKENKELKESNCRLKINRNNRGLIETIDVVRI